MADQKNKITRYVTGDMDEDEEIAFEAEMAEDEDLYLHVQLEQLRLANIQRRVATTLQSEEVKKTDGAQKPFSLKTLKVSDWRRWAMAAAVVGLAGAAVWFFQRPNDDSGQIATETGQPTETSPSNVPNSQMTPEPETIEPPSPPPPLPNYKKIAYKTYDRERPQATVLTSGGQNNPTVITDTAAQAFHAYLEGDSVMVFAYYDQHPNERRAVEWKARYLFEHNRHKEAALLFARLKTFPKYEDVGAWNELLCYLALYRTKKKDFDRLEQEVRNTKYKEDLDQILKQIR